MPLCGVIIMAKKKDNKKEVMSFMKKDIKEDKKLIKGLQSGKKSPKQVMMSEEKEHGLKKPKGGKKGGKK